MKVTIGDVAKEAGVSMSTVSRVINGNYPVKESTRKRVEEAVQKLQFEPNFLARGLISQKSNTVGVIVPSITNVFFPAVVKSIEKALRKAGYYIYLCDTDGKFENEQLYVKSLLSRQVDGIIVIDPTITNMKNGYFEDISKKIPIVFINGFNKDIDCNFVINDEKIGSIQAMKYLFELGHKNIALLRGKDSYSYDVKEEIYINMMKENNLEKCIYIANIGEGNTKQTAHNAMIEVEKLLKNFPKTTAIFTCNDIMALGAINACRRLNLNVPHDISIIGFDNTALSQLIEPKLTTVDQNINYIGAETANMLIDIMNKNDESGNQGQNKRIILSSALVIRESCANINI